MIEIIMKNPKNDIRTNALKLPKANINSFKSLISPYKKTFS